MVSPTTLNSSGSRIGSTLPRVPLPSCENQQYPGPHDLVRHDHRTTLPRYLEQYSIDDTFKCDNIFDGPSTLFCKGVGE